MHKLTKLVTVKVAAAAIGAMTVGGVAFAAATGNLATPDGPAVPATTDRTTGSVPAASNGKSGDSNGNDKSTPDKDKPGNGNDGANPGPSPSLKGLCQAYSSGNGTDHGKWLENPAFGALITAAGGPDKVPSYCQNLLAQQEKPGQRGQGQEQGQGRNEQKQQEHKPDHPGHPQNPGNGNGNGPQPGKPNGPPPSSRPGN